MGFKVGVIGPLNIDLILRGVAPLDIDELKKWSGPSDVHCLTAGAAGYVSQNLHKIGNEIHLVSCVGDDPFGEMILSSLEKVGIDTQYIQIEQGTQGAMAIFVLLFGDNKRPITYRLPTHHGWPPIIEKTTKKYLLNSDLLHSAGYLHFPDLWNDDFLNLFREAKKRGLKTSMDPQFPLISLEIPWINVLKPLIPYIDVIMVDENEVVNITGTKNIKKAANDLIESGFSIVAIKLGEKGALVKSKDETFEIPAIQPTKFVDSIGAGDSFDAGFLQGILEGKSIEKCAEMGVLSATKSIEGVGGYNTFPTREEIKMR